MSSLRDSLESLRGDLYEFRESMQEITGELYGIADELDKHFQNISTAKIGGSAAAIAGGTLATVGFCLSFVTFGASIGLTIAGGAIAGAGGITVGGAQIGDYFRTRFAKESTQNVFDKYNYLVWRLKKRCADITSKLQKYGTIESYFQKQNDFLFGCALCAGQTGKTLAWDVVGRSIMQGSTFASYADDVARLGAGITVFRAMSDTAKIIHIAGGVASIAVMPLDIYTLVSSSIDVHKGNPHETSKQIRFLAKKFAEECPTNGDIDRMINEAVSMISS